MIIIQYGLLEFKKKKGRKWSGEGKHRASQLRKVNLRRNWKEIKRCFPLSLQRARDSNSNIWWAFDRQTAPINFIKVENFPAEIYEAKKLLLLFYIRKQWRDRIIKDHLSYHFCSCIPCIPALCRRFTFRNAWNSYLLAAIDRITGTTLVFITLSVAYLIQ